MVRYGFPGGPIYNGTSEDRAKLRKGYERKAKYSKITDTPVWNGEFGIVYATPDSDGADWERVNDERYACLRDQLRLYADDRISWTIWLYKDIGVQGMVHTPEDSLWNRTFADSLANLSVPQKSNACLRFLASESAKVLFQRLSSGVCTISAPPQSVASSLRWTLSKRNSLMLCRLTRLGGL
jgi:hypothetical protein